MPIEVTNQFRDSIIGDDDDDDDEFVDCKYYSTIKDIYKLNSPLYNDDNRSESSGDDELYDAKDVLDDISYDTSNTSLENIDEESTIKLKKSKTDSFDDNESTIKLKKSSNNKATNSMVSTSSVGSNNTFNSDSRFNPNKISNNIINEANALLNLYDKSNEDTSLYDAMLTKLEIAMEYEISQIRNMFSNMKMPIINELERRHT